MAFSGSCLQLAAQHTEHTAQHGTSFEYYQFHTVPPAARDPLQLCCSTALQLCLCASSECAKDVYIMYTQRAQHKLMLLLPNVYKKSSSHFINELQLPRKAVTTNKKAFVRPKKLITNELAKPRNNTCCIESIFNFKVSFKTQSFKFVFGHICKRLEQCPLWGNYRSAVSTKWNCQVGQIEYIVQRCSNLS